MAEAKAFHKTTWSKVKAGDTVLIAHDPDEIMEVTLKECYARKRDDGSEMVFAYYRLRYAKYGVTFDPDETAYVQSRL